MNESYAEAGCKRKDTLGTYMMRFGLILAAVLLFLFTFQNQILLFLGAIVIVGIFYIFPRLSVEWEYIFCDGQLDFDKISGGQKRKTVKRIDFEQVEICAPVKSHALDGYTYANVKVLDFSSKNPDAKPYAVVLHDKGVVTKIIFEPNEAMVQCIRQKAPRKIVMD